MGPEGAPAETAPVSSPPRRAPGLITAITALLGSGSPLSAFWSFEAAGQWAVQSVFSTGASVLAIVFQLVALVRAFRIEDQYEDEYRQTVRWFIASRWCSGCSRARSSSPRRGGA
jgi:hypothetical protein